MCNVLSQSFPFKTFILAIDISTEGKGEKLESDTSNIRNEEKKNTNNSETITR